MIHIHMHRTHIEMMSICFISYSYSQGEGGVYLFKNPPIFPVTCQVKRSLNLPLSAPSLLSLLPRASRSKLPNISQKVTKSVGTCGSKASENTWGFLRVVKIFKFKKKTRVNYTINASIGADVNEYNFY
jgi:hypothetical protein